MIGRCILLHQIGSLIAARYLCIIKCNVLGRGKKKTYFYPHFVDKCLTPPPSLIHVGGFYNNIIKILYYPHRLTPPTPPALIHISNFLNIFFTIFCWYFFLIFFFCFGQKQAKYALKGPKMICFLLRFFIIANCQKQWINSQY